MLDRFCSDFGLLVPLIGFTPQVRLLMLSFGICNKRHESEWLAAKGMSDRFCSDWFGLPLFPSFDLPHKCVWLCFRLAYPAKGVRANDIAINWSPGNKDVMLEIHDMSRRLGQPDKKDYLGHVEAILLKKTLLAFACGTCFAEEQVNPTSLTILGRKLHRELQWQFRSCLGTI